MVKIEAAVTTVLTLTLTRKEMELFRVMVAMTGEPGTPVSSEMRNNVGVLAREMFDNMRAVEMGR